MQAGAASISMQLNRLNLESEDTHVGCFPPAALRAAASKQQSGLHCPAGQPQGYSQAMAQVLTCGAGRAQTLAGSTLPHTTAGRSASLP
jgi:hypothetical protein